MVLLVSALLLLAYLSAYMGSRLPVIVKGKVVKPATNPTGQLFWFLKR